LSNRTANLEELAPVRKESVNDWYGSILVEHATAGLAFCGQDIEALHHADILMIEGVAMPDKAAHRHRIEIRPKGDRSWRRIIDVHGLMLWVYWTSWLQCRAGGLETQGTRDIQGVVPFWLGEGDTVYFGDQYVVLMEVERMVRKRATVHRPFFIVTHDHVGK
jgi:hypothetical protein